MKKIEIRNIFFGKTEDSFDCEINTDKFGWVPFTATVDDPEQHGKDIYNDIKNGVYGEPQNKVIEVNSDKVI